MAIDENGNTDLMQAVLNRDIPKIDELLETITDEEREALNDQDLTALMLATIHGYLEEMQALINGGALIDIKNSKGSTAMHIGAESDQHKAISKLIANDAEIRTPNAKGYTALMVAAELNHPNSMYAILDSDVAEFINITEFTDHRGYNAMMLAARQNHPEPIRILRAHNADTETLDNQNYTAIMLAAMEDAGLAIEALLEDIDGSGETAEIEARNSEDYTTLMIAAKYNKINALEVLLTSDANVDARVSNGGETALIIALRENNSEAAELLLRYDASVNSIEDDEAPIKIKDNSLRPLMFAAGHGNIHIMKLLMAKDAKLNDESINGDSSLSSAVRALQIGALKLLLARGTYISEEFYEVNDISIIIRDNQEIRDLLYTAEITDEIFYQVEPSKQDKEFIASERFNWEVAAQRFVSYYIIDSDGDLETTQQLFDDNIEDWLAISKENEINLNEVIAGLLTTPTCYLNLKQMAVLGQLVEISRDTYNHKRKYEDDEHVTSSRKKPAITSEEHTNSEEETATVLDEIIENDGDEKESSEGEDDNSNSKPASEEITTNTENGNQRSTGLDIDEKEENESSNIISTKIQDDAALNSWLETIFYGWQDMPKWLQAKIFNSTSVQALLESEISRESRYNPKPITEKLAEIFIIAENSNSVEAYDIYGKVTYAESSSGLVDTSLIYNAVKLGICIFPMVAGSGVIGNIPALGPFVMEAV